MMFNDSEEILSDLLSRWHSWARGYRPIAQSGADPMFRNVKSGKSWDSTADIVEDEIESGILKAVDFHVSEMPDDPEGVGALRSAIYCHARNCCTGRSVWMSPRLPRDPVERGAILAAAKAEITRRLMQAGVM